MTTGEYCNREMVFVEKNEPVSEAIYLMRKHHIGDVIVVERHGKDIIPLGILTDRDIVMEILAEGVDLQSVNIGDVMSFNLVAVQDSTSLVDAIKLMHRKGVRRLPVIDKKGNAVGILTLDDILALLAEQLSDIVGLITVEQHRERSLRN